VDSIQQCSHFWGQIPESWQRRGNSDLAPLCEISSQSSSLYLENVTPVIAWSSFCLLQVHPIPTCAPGHSFPWSSHQSH
jgi:hypothetical protein